jgi:hypothetical protein
VLCWERGERAVVVDMLQQIGASCWEVLEKVYKKGKSISSAHKPDGLGRIKECPTRFEHVACHIKVLVTRYLSQAAFKVLVTSRYLSQTAFKPHCCLNFQSMRTQAQSTDIAHSMFEQIKMEMPWYSSRHTLITRNKDGTPRMHDRWPVCCCACWGPPTQRFSKHLSSYASNLQ